ncbi:MAG TPA: hypothetical protein PLZ57_00475 [Pseudobdellovibrionaceae bacterium]|nr:hypothetical protein [Pseudobdellovibrionaceae bacterium]
MPTIKSRMPLTHILSLIVSITTSLPMMVSGFVFLNVSLEPNAQAAIPSTRTILGRVARQSGQGSFIVEQEVRLNIGREPLAFKERWLIENGDTMRLVVTGLKATDWRWDAIYRDGKRISSNAFESGSRDLKTTDAPKEFLEPFLHHRAAAKYIDLLIRNKMLPASAAKERPRVTVSQGKVLTEVGVRLARSGGVITWAFGEPTPVGSTREFPGAWVEQDAFVLRKLRLATQVEMTLQNHKRFAGGIHLPQERTITWPNPQDPQAAPFSANIRLLSVRSQGEGKLAASMQPASIGASELKAARLPDEARDFYMRFR